MGSSSLKHPRDCLCSEVQGLSILPQVLPFTPGRTWILPLRPPAALPFHRVLPVSLRLGCQKFQNRPTVLIRSGPCRADSKGRNLGGGGEGPLCLRFRIPSILLQGPHLDSQQDLELSYLSLLSHHPLYQVPSLRLGCQKCFHQWSSPPRPHRTNSVLRSRIPSGLSFRVLTYLHICQVLGLLPLLISAEP